jgi:hypothetical protein
MISLILVIISGICNAVMDIISFKYYTSVFSKLNARFWNPEISWKNKYINFNPNMGRRKLFWRINYPVQITDAWHLFKTLGIFLYIFAIVFYSPLSSCLLFDVLLLGCFRNLGFSFFYNKLFRL